VLFALLLLNIDAVVSLESLGASSPSDYCSQSPLLENFFCQNPTNIIFVGLSPRATGDGRPHRVYEVHSPIPITINVILCASRVARGYKLLRSYNDTQWFVAVERTFQQYRCVFL